MTSCGDWYLSELQSSNHYICESHETCPCLNGGTCHLKSASGHWICECPIETGNNINCACDDNMCLNGRPCVNGAHQLSCDCGGSFVGQWCDLDIDECLNANFCNGGNCTNSEGGFTCSCPSTRKGVRCTRDVNECQTTPGICQNGGTCRNEPEFNYTCDCNDGYNGLTVKVTSTSARPIRAVTARARMNQTPTVAPVTLGTQANIVTLTLTNAMTPATTAVRSQAA